MQYRNILETLSKTVLDRDVQSQKKHYIPQALQTTSYVNVFVGVTAFEPTTQLAEWRYIDELRHDTARWQQY